VKKHAVRKILQNQPPVAHMSCSTSCDMGMPHPRVHATKWPGSNQSQGVVQQGTAGGMKPTHKQTHKQKDTLQTTHKIPPSPPPHHLNPPPPPPPPTTHTGACATCLCLVPQCIPHVALVQVQCRPGRQ
jgi:hypothetical protein